MFPLVNGRPYNGDSGYRPDQVKDLSGGISPGIADDLTSSLALLSAAYVYAEYGVVAQAGEHDAVQSGVGLPVAAMVKPTRTPMARGVLDGPTPHRVVKDASVLSRSGLSPMVIRRVTALSGSIPHWSEQLRGVAFDEPGQALIQVIDLPG